MIRYTFSLIPPIPEIFTIEFIWNCLFVVVIIASIELGIIISLIQKKGLARKLFFKEAINPNNETNKESDKPNIDPNKKNYLND